MTFDIPEKLVLLTYLEETDLSVVIDVPVVKSQVFVNFADDDEQNVWIASWSYSNNLLSFFVLWNLQIDLITTHQINVVIKTPEFDFVFIPAEEISIIDNEILNDFLFVFKKLSNRASIWISFAVDILVLE